MKAKPRIQNAHLKQSLFKTQFMLFAIKNRQDLESLDELASFKCQVEDLRLQDNLGKQNFHEDLKNIYEPFTNTIKDSSRDITNTMAETSMENNKKIPNLNEQVSELMNDKRIIAQ